MPYYNYSNHIQVVGRYTYVRSQDPGDVRYSRYENKAFNARGDNYIEWYAGLNWYIYGQKFKLQTGLKYVNMNDSTGQNGGNYDGWDWTTGFRMSW
jgi:phosphate-selective porin OprO/OprP